MTIAIPLHKNTTLYHDNPCTAPKFAIYSIEGDRTNICFSLEGVVDNPWCGVKCDQFSTEQVKI